MYDVHLGLSNRPKHVYSFSLIFLLLSSRNAGKMVLLDAAITDRGYYLGYERFYGPTPSLSYL